MQKIVGYILLLTGAACAANAVSVPEIHAESASSALALLSGFVLIYRGRRKK